LKGGTPLFGVIGLGGRFVSSGGCLDANVDAGRGRCCLGVGTGGGGVVGLGVGLLRDYGITKQFPRMSRHR
jgi:hypothetical protein